MNHIVIDYQQRKQYLVIFVATIIVSFALGFWFGYHSVSPELTGADELNTESQYTLDVNPALQNSSGENTMPVTPPPVTASKPLIKPESKPVPAIKVVPPAPPVSTRPVSVPVPVVKPLPPAEVSVTPVVTPKPVISKPVVAAPVAESATPAPSPDMDTTSEPITNNSLSVVAANTQFTVQAGVFESRDNAMKLVNELNARGFDAYAEEFAGSNGEAKFNVRFSRHSDRDYVQKRLARFKQLYTTAAYIVVIDK